MKGYRMKINAEKTKVMRLDDRKHESYGKGSESTTGSEVQIFGQYVNCTLAKRN